jgi:hypothetical protein
MTAASAAAATMPAAATSRFTGGSGSRARGRKGGEFLRQLLRAAVRALGIFPVARADQQFAVLPAFFAMKLVDWHEEILLP